MFINFAVALSAATLLFAYQAYALQNDARAEGPTAPSACESLATKYPFAPTSETDASLTEIESYLKSILPNTQTNPLPTARQETLSQHIQWAKALRKAIFQPDWSAKNRTIELTLQSISQNLGSVTAFSDEKPVIRSYGPRIPYRFSWPSQLQNLSIHATGLANSDPVEIEFSGAWAFLRLIDSANEHQMAEYRVTFAVEGAHHAVIVLSITGAGDFMRLRDSLICPRE